MLSELRPSKRTDVAALDGLITAGGHHGAMPSRLPDEVLLSLARDFREVEQGTQDSADMAPPLLLVLQLLRLRRARKGQPVDPLQVREAQLARSMQVVQIAVEREIMSRITGISVDAGDDSLFVALDEACRKDPPRRR